MIPTPTSSGGATSFGGLSGRFTWAQAPAVSAADNGKFLGVTGGSLQLYEPALSGFGSGNLPTSRLSGNLSALRVDFTGLTTNQQNAIKSALNITSGSAATIMFGSVGTPELDLYTSGSTASNFTYDQTKREEFIRALGLTRDAGYTRYSGTLTAATTGGGDIGFSASSPLVGALTGTRNLEVAGNPVRIEAILYDPDAAGDELSIYFSGTITETPDIILKVNGQSFSASDNDNSASDSSYGAAGWVITWHDVPNDLMESGTNYAIEVDGGIEAEIDAEIGAIRQVPALPAGSQKRVLTANQDGDSWGNVQSAFQTAEFTSTISAVQRSDQTTQTVSLVTLVHNNNLFSLSGQVITVLQDGNYNFVIIASPRVSNEGLVQFFVRRNNTDETESIDFFGGEARGQSPGRSVFHMALSRNDRLQLQYIPKEVSPPSSTGAPGPITGTTANQYSTRNYTKIAWTGPGTGTYDYVHWRSRPAGQSGTEWGPRQTIYANINSIRVPWLDDSGVDVEVWLEDTHATTGGFSRTTLYTHSSGAFTTEATRQQTVDVTFDMIIGRSDSVLT